MDKRESSIKNSSIIYKKLNNSSVQMYNSSKSKHHRNIKPSQFIFDHIFDENSAQVEVFEQIAKPLINNLFEGYNATIFAYGQTGSGKTYSMMGADSLLDNSIIDNTHDPRDGIIPRVIREIWHRILSSKKHFEFELKLSYLEIYNEQMYDLFATSTGSPKKRNSKSMIKTKLILREYNNTIYVENLNEIYIRDSNEIFSLINSANKRRMTASTKMNARSSRSHAVLTLKIVQEDTRFGTNTISKFCLVDLAGSEKIKSTGATGQRLREAMCINSSLTTLGNCIYKLTEDPIPKHIPYRESKLTQLLHDSLGGNSKTALLICCSPSSTNYAESISTLRFGQRAKRMRNHATVNIIKSVVQYERESKEIKKEIMKLLKILEMCAYDVHKGLLGQLTIENCTSYVKLLELKRNFVSDGGGRNAFQNMANMIKNSSSNFLNLFPSVLKLRREIALQNKQSSTAVIGKPTPRKRLMIPNVSLPSLIDDDERPLSPELPPISITKKNKNYEKAPIKRMLSKSTFIETYKVLTPYTQKE